MGKKKETIFDFDLAAKNLWQAINKKKMEVIFKAAKNTEHFQELRITMRDISHIISIGCLEGEKSGKRPRIFVDLVRSELFDVRRGYGFAFLHDVFNIKLKGLDNVFFGFGLTAARTIHAWQVRDICPPLAVFLDKDYGICQAHSIT